MRDTNLKKNDMILVQNDAQHAISTYYMRESYVLAVELSYEQSEKVNFQNNFLIIGKLEGDKTPIAILYLVGNEWRTIVISNFSNDLWPS